MHLHHEESRDLNLSSESQASTLTTWISFFFTAFPKKKWLCLEEFWVMVEGKGVEVAHLYQHGLLTSFLMHCMLLPDAAVFKPVSCR